MKVLSSPEEIYAQLDFLRRQGNRIGLVPTMGALHDGHLSLVREAKRECDIAVTTIFVNPSQFGPNEDFAKYPRTLDSDLEQLSAIGCDFVFVPSNDHIYPPGHTTFIEPPAVAANWEGKIRPGHFRGVATIVLKLFNMLPARVAYFGRKDYQQVAVISAMVRDLNVPILIQPCETVREPDGLAMSSRNRYLSAADRVRAIGLWHALSKAQSMIDDGFRNVAQIESAMREILNKVPVDSIDYAAIVDPESMEPRTDLDSPVVAIIAARVGTTRLIDNSLLRIQ
ncbi:MAG: pantoate--beta-alanine ligase [Planctomycetes bacterium]|nr:pantoate--beta-alanine ligase [Planctomycetota bacterium]